MGNEASSLAELYQVIPANNAAELVTRMKESGWALLPPASRAFAFEFVQGKGTIKGVAEALGLSQMAARREYNNPVTRAFIAVLQEEVAAHKLINAQWVEQQLMELWPKFVGEEEVAILTAQGDQVMGKKFHSADVTSLLKHFGGDANQKKNTGVQVNINFAGMGIAQEVKVEAIDAE